MKKILFFILLITAACIKVQAQDHKSFAVGIGPEIGFPSHSLYTIGGGGSLKAEVAVSNKASITATAGYSSFSFKNISGKNQSSNFIPLKAGLRYSGAGAYLEGELGEAMKTGVNKQNLFAYSIGPGFIFKLNDTESVDLGFRYENWSKNTLQQIAVRVAFRMGW